MAENKLSWTELRRALANRAGVSEKEANLFLQAFNAQLIEALKQDKQVKINGLGIFRLQAVAPRKSVNVSSGEEITIEGYNKIAFMPEAGVKELVEKGTVARNENVASLREEIDPLVKLGAQADEIVGILGELGQKPGDVQGTKDDVKDDVRRTMYEGPEIPEEPEIPETPESPENPETPESPENPESPEEPESPENPETPEEPEEPVKPEVSETPEMPTPQESTPEKPKYHFMRDTLICVVVLLMLLLVGYFFLRHELSGWINDFANGQPKTENVQGDNVQSTMYEVPSDKVPGDKVPGDEAPSVEEELLLTEEITEGSRLAWIAKKHYGNKVYWPYLYEANKDRITNPSKIAIGTPIRVPKLTAAQRDTTSAEFQALRERAYAATEE